MAKLCANFCEMVGNKTSLVDVVRFNRTLRVVVLEILNDLSDWLKNCINSRKADVLFYKVSHDLTFAKFRIEISRAVGNIKLSFSRNER